LFEELKRRKVFKVGAAYLVVAWLVVQGASIGFPAFDAPPWALRVFILVALLGFPVAVVMAWVLETTSEGVQIDPVRKGTKRIVAVAVGLSALALAWFFYGQASVHPGEKVVPIASGAPAAPPPPKSPAIDPKSIAVLAFADLSPNKDQEYFSDGMAEEILNALAQVPGLTVAGRTSSFSYKGRNVDLREIGKQLGVAHVLEGSVRKQGDQVRITAQLIRTDNGTHLWSKAFDGDLKNVFKLQEDVARAITDELEIVLEKDQRLVPVATKRPEAYALFLKATATFDHRDGPHMAQAAQQLEEAVRLDPNYARAWSRLAAVYAILPTYTNTEARAALPQLTAAAQRATALDPSLAEPWAVRGLAASQGDGDKIASREYFEKALALDPDDITTNFWYGISLLRTGYRTAGTARIDHALAVDPMVPNVMRWRGLVALRYGDLDGAEQFLKRAQAAGLKLVGRELAEIAARRGQTDEARRLWREGTGALLHWLDGAPGDTVVAGLYGGDATAREVAIAFLLKYAEENDVVSGQAVLMLAQMGRGKEALDIANRKVHGDVSDFEMYLFSPAGKSMRALPEYQAYLQAKGLPALWAKYGPPDFDKP
jgi:TolB-like protein/Tfp pilus assembly protein PilF